MSKCAIIVRMSESIFTKMLKGEVKAPIFYSDDQTFAILDHNPVSKGHALVITKEQINRLEDCSDELYEAVFRTVRRVTKRLDEELKPERIAIVVHGFEVPHAHVHIVPMYTGKELNLAKRTDEPAKDQASIFALAETLQAGTVS